MSKYNLRSRSKRHCESDDTPRKRSKVQNYTTAKDGKMNLALINVQELRVTFSTHLSRLLQRVPNPSTFAVNHRISSIKLDNMHLYRAALVKYLPELFYLSFPGIGEEKQKLPYKVGDYVWINMEKQKDQEIGKIIAINKNEVTIQWVYRFESLPDHYQKYLPYEERILTSHTQDLSLNTISGLIGEADRNSIVKYLDLDTGDPELVHHLTEI